MKINPVYPVYPCSCKANGEIFFWVSIVQISMGEGGPALKLLSCCRMRVMADGDDRYGVAVGVEAAAGGAGGGLKG
jgi:hypothetical protein